MVAKTRPEKRTSASEQVHSGSVLVGIGLGVAGVLVVQWLRASGTLGLKAPTTLTARPPVLMNPQAQPRVLAYQPKAQTQPEIKLI